MTEKPKENKELQQRVIVFLNRYQVDFLDKLGKDVLFSGKKKLSRTRIISGLVELLMDLGISTQDIASLADLKQKIIEQIAGAWPTTKELLTFKDEAVKPEVRENKNE